MFHRKVDCVVLLTTSYDVILSRLSQRKICSTCDYVHSHQAKNKNCPHCENPLVKRSDDNEEAIIKRIQNYNNLTYVMINKYYKDKIIEINTDGPAKEVYEQFILNQA